MGGVQTKSGLHRGLSSDTTFSYLMLAWWADSTHLDLHGALGSDSALDRDPVALSFDEDDGFHNDAQPLWVTIP